MADSTSVITLDAHTCRGLLPRRDPSAHKFDFGRLVTLAGSLDYAGAAYLTALGAARAGAGLVAMAVPVSLRPVFAARLPEAILIGLPEFSDGAVQVDAAVAAIRDREPDALVVGPGLKESEEDRNLAFAVLSQVSCPAVVDAGALNMLAATSDWWEITPGDLVLTPHAGEFARLTGSAVASGQEERVQRATEAARRFGHVLVLKGANTVIVDPAGSAAVSPFVNPGLATAGSGDVLSGVIGALMAQGAKPFDAACLGVYLHGRAGERLSFRFGNAGLIATDLPHEIALARHELDAHST